MNVLRLIWSLILRLFGVSPALPPEPSPQNAPTEPAPPDDVPTNPENPMPPTTPQPPAPPPAILSKNLSDAFFRGLVSLGIAWKTDPAFLLAVSAYEAGGVNPAAANPAGAYGLFQWTEAARGVIGWTGPMSAIANLPSEAQLPLIQKYFGRAAPYKSIGEVYGETFLPARMAMLGRAPGTVLTQAGESYYDQNKSLDANADGKITIADLQTTAIHATETMGKRWNEIMARLEWFEKNAPGGGSPPSIMPVVVGGVAIGILIALAQKGA